MFIFICDSGIRDPMNWIEKVGCLSEKENQSAELSVCSSAFPGGS